MSAIQPAKLKVVELREELKARGLDPKGNKPDLVKRLQAALKEERGDDGVEESLNDSQISIEDSQNEDLDTSGMQDEPGEDSDQKDAQEVAVQQVDEPEEVPEEAEPDDDGDTIDDVEEAEEALEEAESVGADEAQPEETEEPMAADEAPADEAPAEEELQEAVPLDAEKPVQQVSDIESGEQADVIPEVQKEAAPEVQKDEAPQQKSEEAVAEEDTEMEGDEQLPLEGGFKVMDSIGETEDAPLPLEEESRGHKRHRSRSRSRSRERKRRERDGRHHRSRSPDHRRRSTDRDHRSSDRHSRNTSPRKDPEENEDWITATNVLCDRFNCDLHMRIDEAGYKCTPITVEGFAFMWSGIRANYGIKSGKVAYEVKILEELNVDHLPEEETSRHVVRVGWSTDVSALQLGEEKLSYGYGGTGKASTDCKFEDYGQTFAKDDVVSCYIDFSGDEIEISYSKNGEDLGKCFGVSKEELGDQALFPHILTKNCEFEINFGQKEEAWFPLKEGFCFINDTPEAERVRGMLPPAKKEECEVIMMIGLPGAGKTHWCTKYVAENQEKRLQVMGTNNIIDKMKVMGLPRKQNYTGRWDVLIDKSTKCLNRMLEIASKKKRNYIIDQTNVYPTARRRKMRSFEGFHRRAIVVVPNEETLKERVEGQEKEEGKDVPDNALWEMKAHFELPEEGQVFDSIEFIELDREEAQKLLETYNKEGKEHLPPDYYRQRYQSRFSDRDNRQRTYRSDNRDGGRDYRNDRRYDNRDRNSGGGRGGGYRGYGGDRRYDNNSRGYNDRNRYDSNRSGSRGSSSSTGSGGYNKDRRYGNNSNYSQGSWVTPQSSTWNQGNWGSNNQGYGNWNQWQQGQTGAWGGQQYNYGQWGNQSGWGQYNQSGWNGYNYR